MANISYGVNQGRNIDLASLQNAINQQKYQKQQQAQAQLMEGIQLLAQAYEKQKQEKARQEQLRSMGIISNGIFQPEKIPAGMKLTDPTTGLEFEGQKPTSTFDISKIKELMGGGVGDTSNIGFTGFDINEKGEPTLRFGQTPQSKIEEQSKIAAAKERETAIGKANRLETVGENVKKQWLKTSPYKGLVTKTGLVPVLGMWDILKKGIGSTDAMQRDQVYASFVKGIRAQLARGMGDVGNLSETEQAAVSNLIPTLFDSYESGIKKIEQISQLVEDIRKTRNIDGQKQKADPLGLR